MFIPFWTIKGKITTDIIIIKVLYLLIMVNLNDYLKNMCTRLMELFFFLSKQKHFLSFLSSHDILQVYLLFFTFTK